MVTWKGQVTTVRRQSVKRRSLSVGEVDTHFVHTSNVGLAAMHMLTCAYELDLEFQVGLP